jgi:hypothetical protein
VARCCICWYILLIGIHMLVVMLRPIPTPSTAISIAVAIARLSTVLVLVLISVSSYHMQAVMLCVLRP